MVDLPAPPGPQTTILTDLDFTDFSNSSDNFMLNLFLEDKRSNLWGGGATPLMT